MTQEKDLKEYTPAEIQVALRSETLNVTPDILARWRRRLAAEYAFYTEQMKAVMIKKQEKWTEIRQRDDIKSDTQADMRWAQTPEGRAEIEYKWELKKLEKLISALNQEAEMISREWGFQE